MPFVRFVLVFGWMGLAACGGKTNSETGDAAAGDGAKSDATKMPPDTCSWSSSFEPLDAAPMRDSCRATRALVTCTGSDGSGKICLTDKIDKPECDISGNPGITYTCKNECKSTEFAATCGTLMGSSVVPPADCPFRLVTPGGILYCCTCSM